MAPFPPLMDPSDWDPALQFITEPLDADLKPFHTSALSQSQVPAPEFHDGSVVTEDETTVSWSTAFYPGSSNDISPPDIVLLSSDCVFFYVHSHVLLRASDNNFNSLLETSRTWSKDELYSIIAVTEDSIVLNIVLHTIYGMSCAHYLPSFGGMTSAVTALQSYGVPLKMYIDPSTPLYALLLSHAPFRPLDLYALASKYDLHDLAVATSSYLLSLPLAKITDEIAEKIGAVYLRRLFTLHCGRTDTLRRLLLSPPSPHMPVATCGFSEQKEVSRAWSLASAYLVWNARPDLSTSTIESVLNPLRNLLSCDLCQKALKECVQNVVARWSAVKRTI